MKNEIADRLKKYADEIRDSYDPKSNLRDVILDSLWYLIELSDDPVRLKIASSILRAIPCTTPHCVKNLWNSICSFRGFPVSFLHSIKKIVVSSNRKPIKSGKPFGSPVSNQRPSAIRTLPTLVLNTLQLFFVSATRISF